MASVRASVRPSGNNPVQYEFYPYEYEYTYATILYAVPVHIVWDSFEIRSGCLPSCLRASICGRSGFVRDLFEYRSGCLPSCLPPCMHVDTGALIVGWDAFEIR